MPEPLRHAIHDLHNPSSGRLDGMQVAAFLSLRARDIAQITSYTDRYVRKNPDAPSFQGALKKVASIVRGLLELTGGDVPSVKIWLNAPHPALDDDAPLDLMRAGEIDVVVDLVNHMLSGAPA